MRFVKLGLLLGLMSQHAFGHGDHAPAPKVAECKAKECTKDEVVNGTESKLLPMMVENGQLDATWKGKKADKAEQKDFSRGKEWVVLVKNDKVADKAKQTLYVFVGLDGTLAGVNYTGK
jgi:hypothetical protein